MRLDNTSRQGETFARHSATPSTNHSSETLRGNGSESRNTTGGVNSAEFRWRKADRLRTQNVASEPPRWTKTESFCYGVHSLFWWIRRYDNDNSRRRDSDAVIAFLCEKKLWSKQDGPLTRVTPGALERMGIEKRFWWISKAQIQGLAEAMTSVLSHTERPSNQDLYHNVEIALFDRFLDS